MKKPNNQTSKERVRKIIQDRKKEADQRKMNKTQKVAHLKRMLAMLRARKKRLALANKQRQLSLFDEPTAWL